MNWAVTAMLCTSIFFSLKGEGLGNLAAEAAAQAAR